MDRHLSLDLESAGKAWKALHKHSTESPVTSHDIEKVAVERVMDKPVNKKVYGFVEVTLVLREVSGGETVEYHYIGMVLKD